MAISTILKDNLLKQLKDPKELAKKINYRIVKYIDSKSEALTCNGPFRRLIFSDNDKNFIIEEIFGMTAKEVTYIIKTCDVIKSTWNIATDPFNMTSTLLMYYMLKNGYEKEGKLVLLYLSLRFYSSLQYKYFPYQPNDNVTNYMINNLSNKFKLKQLGTILATVKDTAEVCLENYRKDLLSTCDDIQLKDFVYGLSTRLNGFLKNIKNEFEIVRKSGKYMNTEEDDFSKENYYLTDNASSTIAKIGLNVSLAILGQAVDIPLCRIAAKLNVVSYTALYNCINTLADNNESEIREIVTLIVQLYLMDPNNPIESVKSMRFFNFSDELYKKSNTKDPSIIRIKEILDQFLSDYCPIYLKTNRVATKNNFRRALFLYFIFIIQKKFAI